MTVIAFSVARFTPADLAEFNAIAEIKLNQGQWAQVTRESGRDFDRLIICLPGLDRPVFRFERDRHGRYRLHFNDRAGWYVIGSGTTAGECLAVWRTRARRSSAT
ncbi:MAG TPA: hypothetical protein VEB64_15235 [Azospirillaceae bacterium]|nr:hypothetical protein [Azospirillaceae bacterium]